MSTWVLTGFDFVFNVRKVFLGNQRKYGIKSHSKFCAVSLHFKFPKLTWVGIMVLYLLVHLYHVLVISNMYYLYTISVEKVLLC